MPLILGQIVYTSFTGIGFRLLASAQVPSEFQQAFIEQVAFRYWDSYNPPESGYRAAYLYQVSPENVLFGWLYNDGVDDMERIHVPYFHCYYLTGPLHAILLENIFTCLHKGPVSLIDRLCLPAKFDTINLGNFWSYQPARPGVAIALDVRKRSHIEIKQGKLLALFVPVDEQQMLADLNGRAFLQRVDFSMYTHYLAASVETEDAAVSDAAIEVGNIKPFSTLRQAQGTPQLSNKEKLQQYEQVLAFAIEREFPISDRTRMQLKHLQQDLELTDEDTNLIEACLTLNENLELSQTRQTKDQPLERFVGAIKNLFINKSEGKH